ncbi:unnamed protein product [Protopolystoma xenopodis]|uniref:Uncharacterized protein n=1 Tax=Protopolystoma xenopodis TaxID=117903 RepID=A0A448WHX3_9PLAT|nr:unnamed protein product [Protopolystoma xenopodis]
MYANTKILIELEAVIERLQPAGLINDICQFLYRFYKSDNHLLHTFVIQLIPAMLSSFLVLSSGENAVSLMKKPNSAFSSMGSPSNGDRHPDSDFAALESCLIGMTSQSVFRRLNKTGRKEIRGQHNVIRSGSSDALWIPALNETSSIFHVSSAYYKSLALNSCIGNSHANPSSSNDFCLPHNAYSEYAHIYNIPELSKLTGLSQQNRLTIAICLIDIFLETLSQSISESGKVEHTPPSPHSLIRFCEFVTRVSSLRHRPRIAMNEGLFIRLVQGLDTVVFFYSRITSRETYHLTPLQSSMAPATAKLWKMYRKAAPDICRASFCSLLSLEERASFDFFAGGLLVCDAVRRCWTQRPNFVGSDLPKELVKELSDIRDSHLSQHQPEPLSLLGSFLLDLDEEGLNKLSLAASTPSRRGQALTRVANGGPLIDATCVGGGVSATSTSSLLNAQHHGHPQVSSEALNGTGVFSDAALSVCLDEAGIASPVERNLVSQTSTEIGSTPTSNVPAGSTQARRTGSRLRQMSTVEVITNASFRPEVVPEDITPGQDTINPNQHIHHGQHHQHQQRHRALNHHNVSGRQPHTENSSSRVVPTKQTLGSGPQPLSLNGPSKVVGELVDNPDIVAPPTRHNEKRFHFHLGKKATQGVNSQLTDQAAGISSSATSGTGTSSSRTNSRIREKVSVRVRLIIL